jgi:CheY-like chemotaxis protein
MLTDKKISNILFVEDSEASRHLMREAFKAAHFDGELFIMENAAQFFQFLNRQNNYSKAPVPDLIVLDLNLPGKNGIEVMEEVKNDPRFQNIPLIVLTGSNAASDIEACSKYGCKYLLKPSRFHELVKLVQSLPQFC